MKEKLAAHIRNGNAYQSLVGETRVADTPAIVPAIRGSAWVTGITQVVVDPSDPFPEGYLLSDTWPGPDTQS